VKQTVYWYSQTTPQISPLSGDACADVVVVGGGVCGLTCAHVLVDRGVDVVLLERAFCGAGASGRTSGFITPDSELELSDLVAKYGEAQGQALWEFAKSGLERIRRTIEQLAVECDYEIQDSLFVARTARAFRNVIEVEHRTHASLGYHSTLYDRGSLATIFGSRVSSGGVRYGGTFGMNSYAYCRALRDELGRRGVRIYEGTSVTRLMGDRVETPGGAVSARAVAVLTDRCLPALGLAAPAVYHIQTFLAISRPLRETDIRLIFPDDRFMVWDSDLLYHYFRVTGDGRLLLGGADLRSMYSRRETFGAQRAATNLTHYLAAHFPSLRVELEHLWRGLIGVSKDFAPIVGTHEAFPTVHFAGAAAGLPWAAAIGEYLAGKITDGRGELDEALGPGRPFPVGRRVQGMLGKPLAFALSHGAEKYLRK
jgi:gamma-glutamylputrescine oxidase